jgi:hypothetical protein
VALVLGHQKEKQTSPWVFHNGVLHVSWEYLEDFEGQAGRGTIKAWYPRRQDRRFGFLLPTNKKNVYDLAGKAA